MGGLLRSGGWLLATREHLGRRRYTPARALPLQRLELIAPQLDHDAHRLEVDFPP
jgi:hypothetical protein